MTRPTTAASLAIRVVFVVLIASAAWAQDVVVYDDALQNGFLDYSYGTPSWDFASTAQVHGGTKSISFIGDTYNALSFAHPSASYSTAQYPTVHFWVHGGAAGGQKLRIYLQLNNAIVANAALDTYITGGAIAAGTWREVTVAIAQAPLSYAGSFDRIDLQSDVAGTQPVLYLDDVSLVAAVAPAANTMQIEHDVTVLGMVSDRFTWQDSAGQPRAAVLAHNNGAAGPGGTHGGELREFQYQTPGGTRTVAASGSGASGFGYVVSHPDGSETCMATPGIDTSMLGHFLSGTFTRVFEGRHHVIFRFTQNYPRYCQTGAVAPAATIFLPVTIEWVFSTGHDNPLWAVTWDMSAVAAGTLMDDSRGPYGELLFDGSATEAAHSTIAGVGWGDRYKFVSTTDPLTFGSAWTWNTANTIPYVKLWTTAVDATMGTVQTQTITQHDAGGYFGTGRWNTTSAGGNACTDVGAVSLMPCDYNWPYQSVNYSFVNPTTNNTRLAWGANFGFLGQAAYYTHGSAYWGGPLPNTTASGWPKQSYSTYVVMGRHSVASVEAQVTQLETVQSLTLSASTGTVVTSGPAGVARADTVTYAPAGYNHVYGALAFRAASNQVDANVGVGAGTLQKPLFIVSNYTAVNYPLVKLGGVTLVADTDYFASLRPAASELWITLGRDLTGATNHLQILQPVVAPAPTVTSVSPLSGSTAGGTPVTIAGTNFANNATVTFGGASATNVVVTNATTITATTPAHAAGAVAVTVTNADLQSGTKASAFTYVAPAPTVASVSPLSGSTAGGTPVTITGTNFANGATVTFGGAPATNVVVTNATTITATTPAHAAGVVAVTVTNADLQSGTKASAFTYVAPAPTVTSVSPLSGSTAGGTPVTITGTNFANGATVTFGGAPATNVVVTNATTITATTPAHAAGAVAVTVTNADLQSGTKASAFTYIASDTRGDANGDGSVNGADVFYLVNRLFAGGPATATACEGDANGDGFLTTADVFFLINFVFASGAAPGGC